MKAIRALHPRGRDRGGFVTGTRGKVWRSFVRGRLAVPSRLLGGLRVVGRSVASVIHFPGRVFASFVDATDSFDTSSQNRISIFKKSATFAVNGRRRRRDSVGEVFKDASKSRGISKN